MKSNRCRGESGNTNATALGRDAAVRWIERNTHILPKLESTLCSYYLQKGRDFPWRSSRDPYRTLIAEMLLQKTGSGAVARIWPSLIQCYPNVESMAAASVGDLRRLVGTLGLRKRVEALRCAARRLVEETGGSVVADRSFLESLPGVGSYTASAVLSFAFDVAVPVVDVNGARVFTRIGGYAPRTLRQSLEFARTVSERIISQKTHREVNYGVVDLGAQACRPKPRCGECPTVSFCSHYRTECL